MAKEKMKLRHLVMDDMDDAMFSLALRDAFPTAIFYPSGKSLTVPHLDLYRTIPECNSTVVTAFFPESGWQPEFEKYPRNPEWYVINNAPQLYLSYSRTRWFWGSPQPARWAFDLPTPEFRTISTNYDPDDSEQRAFVNKVWGILKKLATNRMKSAISEDCVVLCEDVKGSMIWAGHHVLEWCAAGTRRRMIDGWARPCNDWAPPDTPWHLDLRARAEEQFGPDFGGPPEPPDPDEPEQYFSLGGI